MEKRIAVRNIRLCEKDCLCLYVCPRGRPIRNSVIDPDKCVGCGACATPALRAISLVPWFTRPSRKSGTTWFSPRGVWPSAKTGRRVWRECCPGRGQGSEKSNRIMAEDLLREAGYMLPQSANARTLLERLKDYASDESFPGDAVELLLNKLDFNEPPKE
jgi:NAD-dependent dihydropyrimidine dehydrogenase PreA subunit